MAYYRLYFMNRHSGHIERFDEFEAPDDLQAIDRAELAGDGAHPLELWSGATKIFRLDPQPQLAPGALAGHGTASWRLSA